MSGRERAVGQVVEAALKAAYDVWSDPIYSTRSVKDLSDITGLSKPTVRKYLKILVNSGLCVASQPVDIVGTIMYMWNGDN